MMTRLLGIACEFAMTLEQYGPVPYGTCEYSSDYI